MKKTTFLFLNFLTKVFSNTFIKELPGVLTLHRFLYELTRPKDIVMINCQGNKMYVDPQDICIAPHLLSKGIYEPFQTELFKKLIAKDMTVVDIGAHIGYYSLIAASIVGSGGRVCSFEPESNNYGLLIKNINENSYKNIAPMQVAVSNMNGNLKLFLDKSNSGGPSLSEKNIGEKNGFVEVGSDLLDNLLEKNNKDLKVDVIKMDVQGSEGLVLDGAQKILANNNLKIIVEFWPNGLKSMGTDALALLKKMESMGFKMGVIDEKRKNVNYLFPEDIFKISKEKKRGIGSINLLMEK